MTKISAATILLLLYAPIIVKAQQHYNADKLALWERGIDFLAPYQDESMDFEESLVALHANIARRLAPVKKARSGCSGVNGCGNDFYFGADLRGGGVDEKVLSIEERLVDLEGELGSEFREAIALNRKEHDEDCRKSCESFFCADNNGQNAIHAWDNSTDFVSFPFGAVPPEDFAVDFGFPL